MTKAFEELVERARHDGIVVVGDPDDADPLVETPAFDLLSVATGQMRARVFGVDDLQAWLDGWRCAREEELMLELMLKGSWQ